MRCALVVVLAVGCFGLSSSSFFMLGSAAQAATVGELPSPCATPPVGPCSWPMPSPGSSLSGEVLAPDAWDEDSVESVALGVVLLVFLAAAGFTRAFARGSKA
jgi:hypothetical protein